jgi:hypothetical protein
MTCPSRRTSVARHEICRLSKDLEPKIYGASEVGVNAPVTPILLESSAGPHFVVALTQKRHMLSVRRHAGRGQDRFRDPAKLAAASASDVNLARRRSKQDAA